MHLKSYIAEVTYAVRATRGWRSRVSLLLATARFHLNNMRHRKSLPRSPLSVDLEVGRTTQSIRLREETGDLFIFYEVMAFGAYNLPETLVAAKDVRTIVDCGANIGMTALYWSDRYPAAQIIAVEPDPANYAVLCHNVQGIARITPLQAAVVGEPRASVRFSIGRPAWGNAIVAATDAGIDVPAMTLRQIMLHHGLNRIDILKVDIEGGEEDVFAHPSFLNTVGLVAIELHGAYGLDRFQADVAPHGFRVFPSDKVGGMPIVTARRSST
jgi:FkbM family methyltransferase